jgi:Flp pilus assembly protein TadG
MRRLGRRGERGQTAVEFALCATAFFMIVFGLLKVATIYGDYVALQHAARDGTREGSVTRGTGDAVQASVAAAVTTQVRNSAGILNPSDMTISVTGLDSHLAPDGVLWEAHDRVQVTVTYPWSLSVMGINFGSGTMSSTTEAIIE